MAIPCTICGGRGTSLRTDGRHQSTATFNLFLNAFVVRFYIFAMCAGNVLCSFVTLFVSFSRPLERSIFFSLLHSFWHCLSFCVCVCVYGVEKVFLRVLVCDYVY